MNFWTFNQNDSSIHLAVDGSCGGTTLGLQMAKQTISAGGRVLWASPELPDATRFSQIFKDVSLTESSRFHAMNLVGNIDQSVKSLQKTAKSLPNVKLVVLDDYCPATGHIPIEIIKAVNGLISTASWTTLLISEGGTSMKSDDELSARGKSKINSDEVWFLRRPSSDSKRILSMDGEIKNLRLLEEGFVS